MQTIDRLLIANRGEIACRIMRTARDLAIESVAVYSDADRHAVHVQTADQAVPIGPAAAAESYLDIDRILAAARVSGCQAIHPGYGFLSENAAFAAACTGAGLIFVGPSAAAIELMGDKARAKRRMIEAGVATIPGYQGDDQDTATLVREAAEIGYPLMIKAAAGGGGRGLRLVSGPAALENTIEIARSEAINAFGSGDLILEKALTRARHVEVQVFGDQHGTIVHLGERDCSVQRRHQKVIEEAPSPVMTPALRAAMGEAAVAAARAVDYVGAGTVEFLLAEDHTFYFLEMNTRLQVEHPVTELITGLDLVALQLQVAAGEPLGFQQSDVQLTGHAMEVRLYAEDPANEFLPATGHIVHWREPRGAAIRIDAGVAGGSDISPFYDPMMAKIIAHGDHREDARRRLVTALQGSMLAGVATNRDFLIDALQHQQFRAGAATTAFIEEQYGASGFQCDPTLDEMTMAALVQYCLRARRSEAEGLGIDPELRNWASNTPLESILVYRLGDQSLTIRIRPSGAHHYTISIGEAPPGNWEVATLAADHAVLVHDGQRSAVSFCQAATATTVHMATARAEFTVVDIAAGEPTDPTAGSGQLVAPMHGQLVELFVAVGDQVSRGQRLALFEAMKMQHEVVADVAGVVASIAATPGSQIAQHDPILEITPNP